LVATNGVKGAPVGLPPNGPKRVQKGGKTGQKGGKSVDLDLLKKGV